ncbi:MAG: hypothetical protein U0325_19440 [Polyangiales bacterium]
MQYAPWDRLNPQLSAIVANGLCGALLAAWIVSLVVRAVRSLLRAREALSSVATRLRPGVHTIRGVTRLEAGAEGPPVSLTIHQVGEAHQGKHGPFVVWREVRRETRARPFYVELSSGERVRVEPTGESLRYLDDLAVSQRSPGANQRSRTASLDPGEVVFVRGELVRGIDPHGDVQGYREPGARALVLRPAGDGMLVSSHPVDAPHRRRAAHDLTFAALGLVLLGLGQLVLFDDYRALHRMGEVIDAPITGLTTFTTHHKSRTRIHYVVTAQTPEGLDLRDEVSEAAWNESQRRLTIPFTVARRGRLAQVGRDEVGLHRPTAIVAVIVLLGLMGLHAGGASARRAWFERRQVNDREPGTL